MAVATISAGPELRDLKKEATAFVPTTLKRKKASGNASAPKLNAAPEMAEVDASEPALRHARPDIVSTLKEQFGTAPAEERKLGGHASSVGGIKSKDDYEKFVEEMKDILEPSLASS
jgi:hypothetical protein